MINCEIQIGIQKKTNTWSSLPTFIVPFIVPEWMGNEQNLKDYLCPTALLDKQVAR